MSTPLTLLGRWYEPPLIAWPGYSDEAQVHFESQTGIRLEPFMISRGGSYEHYYTADSEWALRTYFSGLSGIDKLALVYKLAAKYFVDAAALDEFNERVAASNLTHCSRQQLVGFIDEWQVLPCRLAGMAFFAVLLDVWCEAGDVDPLNRDVQECVRAAAFARDHCTNVYDVRGKAQAARIFEEVAVRLDVAYDDLEMLFPAEIAAWLEEDSSAEAHIPARREMFVGCNRDGAFRALDGTAAEQALLSVELAATGDIRNNLSGIAASPGMVTGSARIVLQPSDFAEFRKGEVLVAFNTSKSYEPLFELAAAVLTELGGLTSHAAVVCAEMGVPAVVGIQDLVASAPTGSLLAVDAVAGTVTVKDRPQDA